MPILKHAKKKLRQDKKRALKNKELRDLYKKAVKNARKSPTEKNISLAFSQIDKAAKNYIIHANKAARLKASLTKSQKPQAKAETPAEKPKAPAKKKASPKAPAKPKKKTK